MFKSLTNTAFKKLTVEDIPLLKEIEESSQDIKVEYDNYNDTILEITSGDKKVVIIQCTGHADCRVNPFSKYYRNMFSIVYEGQITCDSTFLLIQQNEEDVHITMKTEHECRYKIQVEMDKISEDKYSGTITEFISIDGKYKDVHHGWDRDEKSPISNFIVTRGEDGKPIFDGDLYLDNRYENEEDDTDEDSEGC